MPHRNMIPHTHTSKHHASSLYHVVLSLLVISTLLTLISAHLPHVNLTLLSVPLSPHHEQQQQQQQSFVHASHHAAAPATTHHTFISLDTSTSTSSTSTSTTNTSDTYTCVISSCDSSNHNEQGTVSIASVNNYAVRVNVSSKLSLRAAILSYSSSTAPTIVTSLKGESVKNLKTSNSPKKLDYDDDNDLNVKQDADDNDACSSRSYKLGFKLDYHSDDKDALSSSSPSFLLSSPAATADYSKATIVLYMQDAGNTNTKSTTTSTYVCSMGTAPTLQSNCYPSSPPSPGPNFMFQCCDSTLSVVPLPVINSTTKTAPTNLYCLGSTYAASQINACAASYINCLSPCLSSYSSCSVLLEKCVRSSCGQGTKDVKDDSDGNKCGAHCSGSCTQQCISNLNATLSFISSYANHQRLQNSSCSCAKVADGATKPPSALESWPFHSLPARTPTLDDVELTDFMPVTMSGYTGVHKNRDDIASHSSAAQVMSIDYAQDNTVVGGMILAKGHAVLEHSIATCARFLGGSVVAAFNTVIASHEIACGIVSPAKGEGSSIYSCTIVVMLNQNQIVSLSTWASNRLSSSFIPDEYPPTAIITAQLWSSLSRRDILDDIISTFFNKIKSAIIPNMFLSPLSSQDTQAQHRHLSSGTMSSSRSFSTLSITTAAQLKPFWIGSVDFEFPATLTLQLYAPQTPPDLILHALGWPYSNGAYNVTAKLTVDSRLFKPSSTYLFETRLLTAVVRLSLSSVADLVLVLSSDDSTEASPDHHIDQIFTNMGYWFFTSTDEHHDDNRFVASDIAQPMLKDASHRAVVLGSGFLLATRRNTSTILGAVRVLTPTSRPVDISSYWGVGGMVWLESGEDVYLQLRVESPLKDANYPITAPLLIKSKCWMSWQSSFASFHSDMHTDLSSQLHSATAISFIAWGGSGLSINMSISMSMMTQPEDLAMRKLFAPCTSEAGGERAVMAQNKINHWNIFYYNSQVSTYNSHSLYFVIASLLIATHLLMSWV